MKTQAGVEFTRASLPVEVNVLPNPFPTINKKLIFAGDFSQEWQIMPQINF